MELLESQWFLRMVEAGGKTPADKLIAVFNVTRNWISAPGIHEMFVHSYPADRTHACASLRDYLTDIAAAARAHNPPLLASQLVILLHGAIAEEIRNPATGALDEAATAARAIVARACATPRKQRRLLQAMGGITAIAVLVAAMSLLPLARQAWLPATPPALALAPQAPLLVAAVPTGASPDELAAVLDLQRSIEDGHCPAPQLLALPQGQVTAYMNAINFRTPDNPAADRANMRAFLAWFRETRSSECYFAPSNGHTTVAWVRR